MANRLDVDKAIAKAAKAILEADALIITAGAGMGVDSGLPDFRGAEGFWRAYPHLKEKGINLQQMATPHWFDSNPEFAWGFYGHRYDMYKKTKPHDGFNILLKWTEKMSKGYFVFTSNVDGQFQKAGFPENRIVEWHGTIHYMQLCDTNGCTEIWPVPDSVQFEVEDGTLLLKSSLPQGPPGKMNKLARPNIKMFTDETWLPDRTMVQKVKFDTFFESLNKQESKLVVIEIGCGESVPKIRRIGEKFVEDVQHATLIRVNPTDLDIAEGHILLPMGGYEAITRIDKEITKTKNNRIEEPLRN